MGPRQQSSGKISSRSISLASDRALTHWDLRLAYCRSDLALQAGPRRDAHLMKLAILSVPWMWYEDATAGNGMYACKACSQQWSSLGKQARARPKSLPGPAHRARARGLLVRTTGSQAYGIDLLTSAPLPRTASRSFRNKNSAPNSQSHLRRC
jgi:hypothetical protein